MAIRGVKARQVLDSRGNPTVECEITTANGVFRSIVPSGASTGSHEAVELRDGGREYRGKGVLNAVSNVNSIISKKLIGRDPCQQKEIDEMMINLDGTSNRSHLGANAILSASMAVCRAGASHSGKSLHDYIASLSGNRKRALPVPQLNVINGGRHAGIENDVQEHMIMPIGAKSFSEAMMMSVEVYQTLKNMLKEKFGASATNIADEGGFAPDIKELHSRLELINSAIEQAGYSKKVVLALDCAASEFFDGKTYHIREKKYSPGELVDYYGDLCSVFPICSIEDGMAEDDWDGWIEMTSRLKKIQVVGDDLLVTNTARIGEAIRKKAANSALIKLNQIGTVTETIDAVNLAHKNSWSSVISHRSGETEDSFMADFCVGVASTQIKSGAPARSDRIAKYNQLLRMEEEGIGYIGSKIR
ncbi:phosphopyruvate hydratase [Candidatus Woesearchaeota archaeon]|nr:phosphopyruvate hydratase [Candidatus Woesearchaeota archaeon]